MKKGSWFLISGVALGIVLLLALGASAQDNCACTATYPLGTSVTLTGTCSPGCVPAGWTGDCSGTSSTCTVLMDKAKNVGFICNDPGPVINTLTIPTTSVSLTVPVTIAATGCKPVTQYFLSESSVVPSPADTNWKPLPATFTFSRPGAVRLYAWAKGDSGPISAGVSATITITIPNFSLTVTKSGTGTGSVVSSPAGISCGSTCATSSFQNGKTIILVAFADKNSKFVKWTGKECDKSSSMVCYYRTPAMNIAVNAQFDRR